MCRKAEISSSINNRIMVTPTKVKFHHQQRTPHHHHHQNRGGGGGGNKGQGGPTPPPRKQQQQKGPSSFTSSQSPHPFSSSQSGSSTPSRGSPCFAGSKCFEPPTPDCLPKPPTSWTPTKQSSSSKKQLFGDVITDDVELANQHLKMLLKVHA